MGLFMYMSVILIIQSKPLFSALVALVRTAGCVGMHLALGIAARNGGCTANGGCYGLLKQLCKRKHFEIATEKWWV